MQQTKNLFVRVPAQLHARVKKKSAVSGIPMNQIVIDALSNYLESFHIVARIEDGTDRVHLYFDKGELENVEARDEL